MSITIRALSHRFDDEPVLRDIDLSIESGEIVAVDAIQDQVGVPAVVPDVPHAQDRGVAQLGEGLALAEHPGPVSRLLLGLDEGQLDHHLFARAQITRGQDMARLWRARRPVASCRSDQEKMQLAHFNQKGLGSRSGLAMRSSVWRPPAT